jgi:integrase
MAPLVVRLLRPEFSVALRALAPATRTAYVSALRQFSAYLRLHQPACLSVNGTRAWFRSVEGLDICFAHWVEYTITNELPFGRVTSAFYALKFFNPGLGLQLLRTHFLIKRLPKIRPSRSPPPYTWRLLALAASFVAARYTARMAVAMRLAFDCYLRVSELVRLKRSDVVRPLHYRPGDRVTLILRFTKTGGAHVQHVVIKNVAVARMVVRLLDCPPARGYERLFPFSADRLRAALAAASEHFGMPHYTPHSLRHGGASQDLIDGADILDVIVRGRWASVDSARRYLQHARATALQTETDAQLADAGAQAARWLDQCLLNALFRPPYNNN